MFLVENNWKTKRWLPLHSMRVPLVSSLKDAVIAQSLGLGYLPSEETGFKMGLLCTYIP